MQLHQIRHFLAVIETGSIRAAARKVGLSQPALTKSLRALEQALETPLVQRSARGVTLTEAGRLFLGRARTVQAELRHAADELAQLAGRQGGSVAVGVASAIGALVIPGTLQSFRLKRPDVGVRVVEGTQETLLPLLREGAIDLAACLRMDNEAGAGFKVRALARVRLVAVGRKGHPLRRATTLAQLQHAQWLMLRPRGGGGVLEHGFRQAGLALPPSAVHCDTHGIQVAILAGTDALAMMTRQMLDQPSVRGVLEEIPLQAAFPLLTLGLYSRADAAPTAAVRDFAAALGTNARRLLRMV